MVVAHSTRMETSREDRPNPVPIALSISCALLLTAGLSRAQQDPEQGHSIAKVSTKVNLIVMELDEGVLGKTNLFDLSGRTLRFTPEGSRYRIRVESLHWDADHGPELPAAEVSLQKFRFPFSGQLWKTFLVGTAGSIRFGVSEKEVALDPYGHRDGGIILDRFDQLANVAGELGAKAPAICVFLKPRLSGPHYVKELSDRVVVTWDLTQPYGSLLDFGWFQTIDRFQAVLHRDGSIEMSYDRLEARDGIVGIYPQVAGAAKPVPVHFSSLSQTDGPFAAVYESFHYLAVPRPQDLSCTVIRALGDRFDFLVYYSDFRVDNQEASTPGDGPVGGNVTGIGDTQHDQTRALLESRCTDGRFQQGFAQPVYVGANEAQQEPPPGVPAGGAHDITRYLHPLAEASPDARPLPYNYAVGHLGHEIGHRWSAYVWAKINGKPVALGTWPHWAPGLHSPVAFPYSLPVEASTEGGGVWQDNYDGTYTQLRDGYFVPASGYSYLDLYLMGFISAAEVPDFFLLGNLVPVGKDQGGRPLFKAERTKITVQDVIAAAGPRSPDVEHSQRRFNTGFVVIVEHGRSPSRELIERAGGIREQWLRYWETTTGRRATMSATPR
jgi:hypothetical protein